MWGTRPRTRNQEGRIVVKDVDLLAVVWYARPDDTIGGWCVMPADVPPSAGSHPAVADFVRERDARHIAWLHNEWLHRKEQL